MRHKPRRSSPGKVFCFPWSAPIPAPRSRWDGGENQRAEETCGLSWRQFNRESKSCVCKQGEGRNPFPAPHGQAGLQTLPRGAGKTNPSLQCSPSILPPPAFCPEHGLGYPWGQSGSPVPAVSPLSLPVPPPACSPGVTEEQERPWRCSKAAQTQQNIFVLSTLPSAQTQTLLQHGN